MVFLIPVPGFLYFIIPEIGAYFALEFLHRELARAKVFSTPE